MSVESIRDQATKPPTHRFTLNSGLDHSDIVTAAACYDRTQTL
jgi:hypothetical protein